MTSTSNGPRASHRSVSRSVAVATVAGATLLATIGIGAGTASATSDSIPGNPAVPFPMSSRSHLPASFNGPLSSATDKLAGPLAHAGVGSQAVFVQLQGDGAAEAAAQAPNGDAEQAADARRAQVANHAENVLDTAQQVDGRARQIFQVSNAVPGIALNAGPKAIRAMAERADVARIYPLPTDTVSNAGAAQLTHVLRTWRALGDLGHGVKVGIIDTGIDFTHADFGGVGTPAAYDAARAHSTDPGWRSTLPKLARAKIAGGYDFVGDDYNADPGAMDNQGNSAYQPVPHPDRDPLDCEDHGTHVAGTLAGYGVTGAGRTFTGNYRHLTGKKLYAMDIGPGMAPKAKIYSLKVFGCSGATNAVIPALDWALDPNGDGDFSDHLDIVNLSLGTDYGTVDDPENLVVNQLAAHGVLTVAAAGNNGDLTDTGGAPGNAVGALDVASSVDAYQLRDGLRVNAPASVKGIADGQLSVDYDWAAKPAPVTGHVVAIPGGNADGCHPLSPTDAAKVAGRVAWLYWDDNDLTRRCGSTQRTTNVERAGAIGAVFTSSLDVFNAAISGNADIPAFQLSKNQTDRLRPALRAGTLDVTFDGSLAQSIKSVTPAISDTLSTFSSRGTHGSLGVVKPDVAAPGDTITSAKRGSGFGSATFDGTSMATPQVAGIAALVKSRHPHWHAVQIKAAVMNTAVHDVFTGENHTGHRYAPARDGAGRVDARYAVGTRFLAHSFGDPIAVSASFGVVRAPITKHRVVRRRQVTVRNLSGHARTLRVGYGPVDTQPGVRFVVSRHRLRVPAHRSRTVGIRMVTHPSSLRHTIDPTMARHQLKVPRQFVPDASGHLLVKPPHRRALRVPVYAAAKPVAETSASVADGYFLLSGKGVAQGSGSRAYVSAVSVLSYGTSSPRLPRCQVDISTGCVYNKSSRAGDLKYVGADTDPGSGLTWFGIVTRRDWATIGNSIQPYVDIDTTGDHKPDYQVDLVDIPGTDLLYAVTLDLHADPSKPPVDLEPVNFNDGNVDTNVFDTNVALIPVSTHALGDPVTITYDVRMYDASQGAVLDGSGPVTFDVSDPPVRTPAPLYVDAGNTAIPYAVRSPGRRTGTKALVIHLHGANHHRAQVLRITPSAR